MREIRYDLKVVNTNHTAIIVDQLLKHISDRVTNGNLRTKADVVLEMKDLRRGDWIAALERNAKVTESFSGLDKAYEMVEVKTIDMSKWVL